MQKLLCQNRMWNLYLYPGSGRLHLHGCCWRIQRQMGLQGSISLTVGTPFTLVLERVGLLLHCCCFQLSLPETVSMLTLTRWTRNFCHGPGLKRSTSSFPKWTSFCGGGGSNEAIGSWSKAAVTTLLCLFLEHLCKMHPVLVHADECLRLIATFLSLV